ncbi:MAG: alpha/beta fold hydrolase [Alphaproteobacteria bacterium]|nr:alpha/beta fold hydrolase [Alphaproteobacteria bacterium]
MSDLTVNGLRFHVRIDGPEGAPWVTFSNSLATDLGLWDEQVALIADRFRVLRYDTRGHGRSERAPPPYDFATLQADVIGLWDALGIAKSHYVGLSLGGSTGIGLAIAHPGRVASLAACDCRVTAPEPFRQAWESRIDIALEDGMAGLVEETMTRWFTEPTLSAGGARLDRIREMIRATSVDGFIGCARALQGIDYLDRVAAISCPTLFVVGEADPAATPELIGAMHARVNGSQLIEIPGAAHISNIENPSAFNEAVIPFLDSRLAG